MSKPCPNCGCDLFVAEWLRALNSSSCVSVQQNVGSNPGRDTGAPEQPSLPRGKWVLVKAEMVYVND